jgi:hemerythrin-like domain-containing protein
MTKVKKISDLLGFHDDLDVWFRLHQVALLRFDFAKALEHLLQYESGIRGHMRDEENYLLPIYAERAEIPKSGGVQLFLNEHEKMLAYVRLFNEQTEKLISESEPEDGLILLIDREAFYKRLSSHHNRREREILYPMLDEITTADEKAAILERAEGKPDASAKRPRWV